MNIEPVKIHRLKNKLAIILGFCELLLEDAAEADPRRADLLQIQLAAQSALVELPALPANEFATTIDVKPEATHED